MIQMGFQLQDFYSLAPLFVLFMAALLFLVLEIISFQFVKKIGSYLAIFSFLLSMLFVFISPKSDHLLLTRWLHFDFLSDVFSILFLTIGIVTVLLSHTFFQRYESTVGEYYFLLLTSVFGLMLIGYSADLLTLFLGIEFLSISLYVMAGYCKEWEISGEAQIKYFLTGAVATGFLVYGIALLYGAAGTTAFNALLDTYHSQGSSVEKTLFIGGVALITVGLAFKAAIFPFHIWASDVYAGSSTPVTAFMAVGTKGGAFAALIRFFLEALPQFEELWTEIISFLAIITIVFASLVALRQKYLRSFFAYSGISHAGYMLIAIVSGTSSAIESILFYFVVYILGTIGAFCCLSFFEKSYEGVSVDYLKGVMYRNPIMAALFTLFLLTLAGIPPTAGFFAKFYIFKIAFQQSFYVLVVVALIASILSIAYYFRIISKMLEKPENQDSLQEEACWPEIVLGGLSSFGIVFITCFPFYLFDVLKK